jgi:hypothetical protein
MLTPGKTPAGETPSVFGTAVPDGINESHEDFVSRSLRERLKGVCAKLSREDFDALIATMTREQLRGEKSSRR